MFSRTAPAPDRGAPGEGRRPMRLTGFRAMSLVAATLGGDAPLAMPSPADVIWIAAGLVLAGALLVGLTRLEATVAIVLDVAAIAIGIGVLAGVALVGPDLAASELPYGTRVTQAAYAVIDVVVISVVLRTLLVPRHAPLS